MPGKNALSISVLLASLAVAGPAADPKLELLPQNWTSAERHQFWFIDQGSKIMPMEWFLNLERSETAMFKSPENLRRYGFVIDTSGIPGGLNGNSLPIGFAMSKDGYVGLTCAACHTGNIRYNGRSILVEGAPAMLNFDLFLSELVDAMVETRDDTATRERFLARFQTKPDMTAFNDRTRKLQVRRDINRPAHPAGFGRVDAFGHIFNQVAVEHLGNPPEVASPPNAPASYPMLWDIAQHPFVQWNYSAPNLGVGERALGSLVRNIGEVLGVFGEIQIEKPVPIPIIGITVAPEYSSSANIDNLMAIEGLLAKLKSPGWPLLFSRIDPQAAKSGRTIYAKQCAHCHAVVNPEHLPLIYPARHIALNEVGTEPDLAMAFLNRQAPAGLLLNAPKGILLWSSPLSSLIGTSFGPGNQPLMELTAHLALNAVPDKLRQLEAFSEGLIAVGLLGQDPRYKSRPLDGIWASAPYLHNGSVPTLYDLLLPVEERPKSFCVGDGEFDPVKVGYKTYPGPVCPDRTSLVDTSLPGSRNIGHPYGVNLNEVDRRNLVEYLKSL